MNSIWSHVTKPHFALKIGVKYLGVCSFRLIAELGNEFDKFSLGNSQLLLDILNT